MACGPHKYQILLLESEDSWHATDQQILCLPLSYQKYSSDTRSQI